MIRIEEMPTVSIKVPQFSQEFYHKIIAIIKNNCENKITSQIKIPS